MKRETQVTQRSLFFLAEIFFGIASERATVERPVGRVEVDKVALARVQFTEIACAYIHRLQSAMASPQYFRLDNGRLLVTAHRHVELAFGVDAPEAVVAGFVEVDEARGYLNAVVELVLTSDFVVVVFAVLRRVLAQLDDEGFGVALDDLVGIDEVKVDIT